MKKTFITLLLMTAFIAAEAQQVMRKEKDGTYIVNTTTIANDVEGYAGPTPVEVYIKKNKVERIEFLKSMESPKYYGQVKKALLEKWNGMTVKDARTLQVDAVTGATPQTGGRQTFTWDFTDQQGKKVKQGKYRVMVEATLYQASDIIYSGTFSTQDKAGNVALTSKLTEPKESHQGMITDVKAVLK
jgi:electron transport complex protein RnfG